jgi:hypothetical protein
MERSVDTLGSKFAPLQPLDESKAALPVADIVACPDK